MKIFPELKRPGMFQLENTARADAASEPSQLRSINAFWSLELWKSLHILLSDIHDQADCNSARSEVIWHVPKTREYPFRSVWPLSNTIPDITLQVCASRLNELLESTVDRGSRLESLIEVNGEFTTLGNALWSELEFLFLVSKMMGARDQRYEPCRPPSRGQMRRIG